MTSSAVKKIALFDVLHTYICYKVKIFTKTLNVNLYRTSELLITADGQRRKKCP